MVGAQRCRNGVAVVETARRSSDRRQGHVARRLRSRAGRVPFARHRRQGRDERIRLARLAHPALSVDRIRHARHDDRAACAPRRLAACRDGEEGAAPSADRFAHARRARRRAVADRRALHRSARRQAAARRASASAPRRRARQDASRRQARRRLGSTERQRRGTNRHAFAAAAASADRARARQHRHQPVACERDTVRPARAAGLAGNAAREADERAARAIA